MSDVVFPDLPGLTFDFKMRPTFATLVQASANRAETRDDRGWLVGKKSAFHYRTKSLRAVALQFGWSVV